MAERKKGKPWCYVTWVTGVMADEDKCHFAPWFKARYKYDKVEDESFDSRQWQAEHKLLRDRRAQELREAGWDVRVEIDFTVRGRSGSIVAGKPDIVALDHARKVILVSDPKGGKRYQKHWYQVAVYMRWIRQTLGPEYAGYLVEGEIFYGGDEPGIVSIAWEDLTPSVLAVMNQELQALGLAMPPEKTPSENECRFCNIPKSECPEKAAERVVVEDDNF